MLRQQCMLSGLEKACPDGDHAAVLATGSHATSLAPPSTIISWQLCQLLLGQRPCPAADGRAGTGLGPAGGEADGDLARFDPAIDAKAGRKLEAIGACIRAAEQNLHEDILVVEPAKLDLRDAIKREADHGMPVGHKVTVRVSGAAIAPVMYQQLAGRALTVERDGEDLGIVEGRHVAEPRHELGAARNLPEDRVVHDRSFHAARSSLTRVAAPCIINGPDPSERASHQARSGVQPDAGPVA